MIIKREIFSDLISHLKAKEISLIVGPRQAGKTTVMKELQEYLEKRGEATLYLNLDLESDWQFFSSQTKLIDQIKLSLAHRHGFVFIDEIQRKENAGLFLKGIYDLDLPYKFVVSGSGSVELKEKIHESLAGRKRIFELFTLSFKEFADFRTNYQYADRIFDYLRTDQVQAELLLTDYLTFGGYPKVVLSQSLAEKVRVIEEIYQSYLVRDVSYIYRIEKTEDFTRLVKLLAALAGKNVSLSYLAKELALNLLTIKKFLWYLEKTFIIAKTTPYFKSLTKEIRKSPVYYFWDLGLANFARESFDKERTLNDRSLVGFIFQNFIFRLLKEGLRHTASSLHFWRTTDGAETDFVIERGITPIPVEVKYKRMKEVEIERSLRSFIRRYQPEKAFVINLELSATVKVGRTQVIFLPFYRLITGGFPANEI